MKFLRQTDFTAGGFILAAFALGLLLRLGAAEFLEPGSIASRVVLANGMGLIFVGFYLLIVKLVRLARARKEQGR